MPYKKKRTSHKSPSLFNNKLFLIVIGILSLIGFVCCFQQPMRFPIVEGNEDGNGNTEDDDKENEGGIVDLQGLMNSLNK